MLVKQVKRIREKNEGSSVARLTVKSKRNGTDEPLNGNVDGCGTSIERTGLTPLFRQMSLKSELTIT